MAASVDALRDAILANPEDDSLRRVYADHLIERGDPRGLLISCQLARAADVEEDKRLLVASRAQRIAALHVAKLCHDTAALDARFERGFLHAIAMRAEDFATHAPRLFAEEPIEAVRIYTSDTTPLATLERIAAIPGLARVRDLALGVARTEHFAPFVHTPHLVRLHTLEITARDRRDLTALADWQHTSLRLLLLECPLDETTIHFAHSRHLCDLAWLYADVDAGDVVGPLVDALPSLTHVAFPDTPPNAGLRSRGFVRAPSPRPRSRETRRITEHLRGSWDLWVRR